MLDFGFHINPAVLSTSTIVVSLLLAGIFSAYTWFRIFSKIGYSGWWGLVMLISPLTGIATIYLAFSKWPVESDVEWYVRSVSDAAKEEAAEKMLEEAANLRAEFKFEDAKSVYRAVLRMYPGTAAAQNADKGLSEIRTEELQRP